MHNQLKISKTVYFIFLICRLQSRAIISQTLKVSSEPQASEIYTSDIDNFYTAFDLAMKDTLKAKKIFKKKYFSKGTKGLKDFYKNKIKNYDEFAKFVITHQDFYQSIRADISDLEGIKNEIYVNFESFKRLYPKAVFPDVYFVVGKFSSNGTISKSGLLIGTEIISRTNFTKTENWNKDILRISMLKEHIPVTVSHELVHFNQSQMTNGSTLLAKSLREGSAEFISELISGKTDGDYSEFKGKEVDIWNDFQSDKDKSIWVSWNDWQQAQENRPQNAGYWAGYIICKAYYNQVKDESKAVEDILNIQNYGDFYEKSNVEKYILQHYGK